jgi:hypothetical protein
MSAQTPQIIGTGITNAVWGISSVAYAGFCTSIDLERDGEVSKIYDGNGFTIGLILFDDSDKGTVQMVLQSTDAIPARGTVVTVAAVVSFIVLTNKRMYSWRDQAKWQFTVENFVNLVLGS